MRALTAAERGDLAEEMLPVAARLSTLVHGDGGREDITRLLDVLDDAEKTALIVVLAGLADPDRPLGALLGWLDFDEHGQSADADQESSTTLQQIADALDEADPDSGLPDEIAVARYLSGQQVKLRPEDRIAAIQTGMRRGLEWEDLDRLSGLSKGSTQTFFRRQRKAAALRGEVLESGTTHVTLSDADAREIREKYAAGRDAVLLAFRFGVDTSAVYAVLRGDSHPDAGGPVRRNRGPVKAARLHGRLSETASVKTTTRKCAAS